MILKSMGRIIVTIDDKIEKRFRKAVIDALGMSTRHVTLAVEQALENWIELSKDVIKEEKKTSIDSKTHAIPSSEEVIQ